MADNKVEWKICPFCGEETGIVMRHAYDRVSAKGDDGMYWVTCHHCGTDGPYCDSREEAKDKWNTRADDAPELKRQRDELRTACASVLHILESAWSNHEDGPILYQPLESEIITTLRKVLGNIL